MPFVLAIRLSGIPLPRFNVVIAYGVGTTGVEVIGAKSNYHNGPPALAESVGFDYRDALMVFRNTETGNYER